MYFGLAVPNCKFFPIRVVPVEREQILPYQRDLEVNEFRGSNS